MNLLIKLKVRSMKSPEINVKGHNEGIPEKVIRNTIIQLVLHLINVVIYKEPTYRTFADTATTDDVKTVTAA